MTYVALIRDGGSAAAKCVDLDSLRGEVARIHDRAELMWAHLNTSLIRGAWRHSKLTAAASALGWQRQSSGEWLPHGKAGLTMAITWMEFYYLDGVLDLPAGDGRACRLDYRADHAQKETAATLTDSGHLNKTRNQDTWGGQPCRR